MDIHVPNAHCDPNPNYQSSLTPHAVRMKKDLSTAAGLGRHSKNALHGYLFKDFDDAPVSVALI